MTIFPGAVPGRDRGLRNWGALPFHTTVGRRRVPEALPPPPKLQERRSYRHSSFTDSQIANRESKTHSDSPAKRVGLIYRLPIYPQRPSFDIVGPFYCRIALSLKLRLILILLFLCCTVSCDQTTKHIVRNELGGKGIAMLPHGFGEFRFTENPGAFLSFGDSLSEPLRLTIFTVGAAIGLFVLLAYLVFGVHPSRLFFAGFGLAWAGGISNLIDRVTQHGLVSDFMVFRIGSLHTGIFNVADVVIMIGAAAIVFDYLLRRHRQVHN